MATALGKRNGFPAVPADNRLPVLPVLDGTDEIIAITQLLGPVFAPARNDVINNIKILRAHHAKEPGAYSTFTDIVERHVATGATNHRVQPIYAILWLKRGLDFMCQLLRHIVQEQDEGATHDSLYSSCIHAYDRTLKQYHHWFFRHMCSVMLRCVPYKSNFLKLLAGSDVSDLSLVVEDIRVYTVNLQATVDALHLLLSQNHMDFPEKV